MADARSESSGRGETDGASWYPAEVLKALEAGFEENADFSFFIWKGSGTTPQERMAHKDADQTS